MLTITVPGVEMFDESTEEFTTQGDVVLELEHSLVSLSKWESEFEKPFLTSQEKTPEEMLAYIRAMILTPDYPNDVLAKLTDENYEEINAHLEAKMTGTTVHEPPTPRRRPETISAELIYYWMTVFSIPFECETWHLNRLFMLIRVCSAKQTKEKPKSKKETAMMQYELNQKRKAAMNTTG